MSLPSSEAGRNAANSAENEANRGHSIEALREQILSVMTLSPVLKTLLLEQIGSLEQICSLETTLRESTAAWLRESATTNQRVSRAWQALEIEHAISRSRDTIIKGILGLLQSNQFLHELDSALNPAAAGNAKEARIREWMARYTRIAFEKSRVFGDKNHMFDALNKDLEELEAKQKSDRTPKRSSRSQ